MKARAQASGPGFSRGYIYSEADQRAAGENALTPAQPGICLETPAKRTGERKEAHAPCRYADWVNRYNCQQAGRESET